MERFEELINKRTASKAGGGEEKAAAQHSRGKMTARERVEYVLDSDSFVEMGTLINLSGAGVITGYGTIENRLVYVISEDFTVNGGILNKKNADKIVDIMNMALKMGAPLIQIFDSVGGDATLGMDIFSSYGRILKLQSKLSGVIPRMSVICGPCTGSAAVSACMSDITIMTKGAELYINPSETIEKQSRTYSDINSYATAEAGSKSGSVQIVAKDDKEAIDKAKKVLAYLPQNNCDIVGFKKSEISLAIDGNLDEMYSSGSSTYKEMIESIADKDTIIDVDNEVDSVIHTSLIKLNGLSVGVIASDNSKSQLINIRACEKAARFVKLCNAFNISILSIVDCKGFVGNAEEEINGLSLYGAKLVFALTEANVPKISLIIGNSIGVAHMVLASKETSFDMVYALPNAVISIGEPEQIVKELYREEILLSSNPKEKEKQLLDTYIKNETSAFKAAELGHIDDVIKPSEGRLTLLKSFDVLQSKREINYPKKHGNVLI